MKGRNKCERQERQARREERDREGNKSMKNVTKQESDSEKVHKYLCEERNLYMHRHKKKCERNREQKRVYNEVN